MPLLRLDALLKPFGRSFSSDALRPMLSELRKRKKHQRKLLAKDAFTHSTCPHVVHLIDGEIIDYISKTLCPDPEKETAHIVECSAGPGFLTEKLLESGVRHVHVFEHEEMDYLSMLQSLAKQHEGRVSLHLTSDIAIDFARDLRLGLATIVPEVSDVMAYKSRWRDGLRIKSFLPVPPFTDKDTVSAAISDLCRRDGMFGCGRMQLLLLLSFHPVVIITADQHSPYYGFLSIMSQSMFDVEVGQKVPLHGVIPVIKGKRVTPVDNPLMDMKSLYVVSMTPKSSLVDDIPVELWGDYRFFVRQATFRKSGHVIPFFEKYFPGCGIRLIRSGVPLYSRFSEFDPNDFVRVFNECISWPEYSSSTFKMASSSFADEVEEEEEEPDRADEAEGSGGEKLVSDVFA